MALAFTIESLRLVGHFVLSSGLEEQLHWWIDVRLAKTPRALLTNQYFH